jgi:replicative DNA helicase
MGKTSLAVNMVENAALGFNKSAAIFSMEMSAESLTLRMISSLGRINQSALRSGKLQEDDWPRIDSAMTQLSGANIFVDETPGLSPTEIRARARRLKRERGLDLIVVDYLQLMQVAGTKENRATEIAEISRSLKALAKELKVPIIALSQLNRGVEQRQEKKPVMSDLRECVTGETLVCLADGRRVPIQSLVGTTPEVWAMDANQKIIKAQSDLVWSKGVRQVFCLQLASGRKLRATPNHRIFTGDGWRCVGQLGIGDRVAVARRFPTIARSLMRAQRASQRAMASMLGTAFGGVAHFKFSPSRATLSSYAELLDSDTLRTWSNSDLFWDRVVAVGLEGEEEVFDITVPGPASWLADGIVSHNSGSLEQDADLILLIYREEFYEPNTTRKGIADIIVAKHRNGPTGDVQMTFLGQYTKFENYAPESYAEGVFR